MNISTLTLNLIHELIYAINRFLSFNTNSVSFLGSTILTILLIRILKSSFNYAKHKPGDTK